MDRVAEVEGQRREGGGASAAADAKRVPPQRISRRARALVALYRNLLKPRSFDAFDVAAARRLIARLDRALGGTGIGVRRAPVDAHGVPGEWITGRQVDHARTILYLHGGGFMFSTPRTHARLAAKLATLLGACALVPDYRLAPEHPLPAAHDDCFTAYRWLLDRGHDPARIVLVGDSAGGLLVLSTLQRIRDAGLPHPACGVLFSPGADLATAGDAAAAAADDPLISAAMLALMQRLVIDPIDPRDARISPCAGSLAGLPPLLIQVGSTEALLGQALAAAECARAAGTPVELQVWPQMPHVFQAATWLPETRRALASVREFVAARMTPVPRGSTPTVPAAE
jgi:monoterpene epsilon-lactone hydrolase